MKKLEDLLKAKISKPTQSVYTKEAIKAAYEKTADQRYWTDHVRKVEITRGF